MPVAGDAVTDAPVADDNPAVGVHVYVAAPLAVSVTPVPGVQYVAVVGVTPTVGNGLTVTATEDVNVLRHPSVTVTVYVVVTDGVTFILAVAA